MTKKEMFVEIINVATVAERQDLVEFAKKEIELLNKRNSKETKAHKEKMEERANLAKSILNALSVATCPKSTMEIANAVVISPQKATPILKDLVEKNKVMVRVKKGRKLYSLPID